MNHGRPFSNPQSAKSKERGGHLSCCVVRTYLLLFALTTLPFAAHAQSATATLSGTVEDQNGAVIPGAAITLTNTANGQQRQATTDDHGYFTLPLLSPGTYTLRAEHQGFAPTETRNVILNVGDQRSLQIQLQAGDINATVQVTTDAPLINESTAVGTIVDRQFVGNIALNGRSLQPLIELSPGVVPTVTAPSDQGQFSVNGQRANANYFVVDGVSANVQASVSAGINQSGNGSLPVLTATGGTNNLVSIDALQEFKILTSSFAPEFGRTPGAQVLISTRSGTNQFHGALFEYFRNDRLDANNWFANANRLPKPALRQNDFGGVIGGPVLLPGYNGHNRTFFFFSYEGLRLRQPVVAITDVPSLTTRQNAPAALQPYLNAFPRPTGSENPTTGLAPFAASFSNPATLNATSFRIDHTLSKNSTLFGRFNQAPSESVQRNANATSVNTSSRTFSTTQTLTLGYTALFTPKVSNDLRINYSRVHAGGGLSIDNFGGAVVPADSVLFPASTSKDNAGFGFRILNGASTGLSVIGKNADNLQRQINLVDGLSLSVGSHSLKFGVDYRRLTPVITSVEYTQSALFFDLGQILSGTAGSVSVGTGSPPREPIFTNFSLYGQDSWRVSSRLSLTYGVRWDYDPAPHEANGNEAITLSGLGNPSTFALAPRGTPLYRNTKNNFAPRLGVSYVLSEKQGRELVLRGGFGMFYDLGSAQIADAYRAGSFPYGATKTLASVTFPLSTQNALPPTISTSPPVNGFLFVADPNLRLPYTLQWNVAGEKSLGHSQTVSATYVGAIGKRLFKNERFFNLNASFPNIITITRNNAASNYNALQLQYQRRLSRGVQALVSYTWSHSLDDISAENPSLLTQPAILLRPGADRGSSDFDVRHNFSAAVTYDIPSANAGPIGNALLRHWSIDSIVRARSATPVDLIGKTVLSGGFFYRVRPDVISGVPLYLNDPNAPGGRRFNPAAFVAPSGTRQGTLGRNVVRGFPFFQLDTTVRRQFNLTERFKLLFRADFFNIFNHPNFGVPGTNLAAPSTFGRATSTYGQSLGSGGLNGGFNPLYQSGGPRSIQFSIKLEY